MGRLHLEQLGDGDFPEWDRYVAEHPSGTIFQTAEWLTRVCQSVEVFVATDASGAIVGGLALGSTRKYGVTACHIPPYTPYFGPLVSPSRKAQRSTARTEEQKVLDSILAGLPRRVHYDFKLPPGGFDLYPYIRQGFSPAVQYTHEIAGSSDEYRRHMGRRRSFLSKAQQLVRRGELQVTVGADPFEVLDSLRSTARQRGFNPREDLLGRLVTDPELADRWTAIVIREPAGRLLAGSLLIADDRRVYYQANTVPPLRRPEWQHVNLLAVDLAITRALDAGKVFDFEGSMLPGVEEFYRRLGAVQVPTYRLQRSRSLAFFAVRSIRQFLQERTSAHHDAQVDDEEGHPAPRVVDQGGPVTRHEVAVRARETADGPVG